MIQNKRTYSPLQKKTAFFMIATLLWLTISAPFVNTSLQQIVKKTAIENSGYAATDGEDSSGNPENSSEEKTPSTITLTEEFLHDHHKNDGFLTTAKQYRKIEDERIYIAYHGELLVPPPDCI